LYLDPDVSKTVFSPSQFFKGPMKSILRSFCGLFSISGCLILLTQNTVEAQYMQWTWMHGDRYGGQAKSTESREFPIHQIHLEQPLVDWVGLTAMVTFGFIQMCFGNTLLVKMSGPGCQGDTLRLNHGTMASKGVMHPGNDPGTKLQEGQPGQIMTVISGFWWPSCKNDLWRFSPKSNQWTWMHGDSIQYASSRYGKMGIPDPLNTPGSTLGAKGWVDA
jgi:hypothetical protein